LFFEAFRMSPTVPFTEKRSSPAEIFLWVGLCFLTSAWSLISASPGQGVEPFIILHAALAAFTVAALAWRVSGGALAPYLATLWAVVLLAIHVTESWSVGFTILDSDIAAAIFLMASLVYGGPARVWWLGFMPLTSLLLLTPIAVSENHGGMESEHLLVRMALLPILSLAVGSLLAVLRDTRRESILVKEELSGLHTKGRTMIRDMKILEKEMKVLVTTMKPAMSPLTRASVTLIESPWRSVAMATEAAKTLTHSEVQSIVLILIEEFQLKLSGRPALRLTFSGLDNSSSLPLALRVERDVFAEMMIALITSGLDALGGGAGHLRVALTTNSSGLLIVIEDNGHGLNEHMLAKRQTSSLSLGEVRSLAARTGGALDHYSRLGVGARSELMLARADIMSIDARESRRGETPVLEIQPPNFNV
jgi:signal transduction histidine kinase